ncbi:putative protein without homology [Propionibacterium freudenreichii subsp. shermanii]|nr:putative protein without homology [Propionibacterium freudenreichii subsp. shermanii]
MLAERLTAQREVGAPLGAGRGRCAGCGGVGRRAGGRRVMGCWAVGCGTVRRGCGRGRGRGRAPGGYVLVGCGRTWGRGVVLASPGCRGGWRCRTRGCLLGRGGGWRRRICGGGAAGGIGVGEVAFDRLVDRRGAACVARTRALAGGMARSDRGLVSRGLGASTRPGAARCGARRGLRRRLAGAPLADVGFVRAHAAPRGAAGGRGICRCGRGCRRFGGCRRGGRRVLGLRAGPDAPRRARGAGRGGRGGVCIVGGAPDPAGSLNVVVCHVTHSSVAFFGRVEPPWPPARAVYACVGGPRRRPGLPGRAGPISSAGDVRQPSCRANMCEAHCDVKLGSSFALGPASR